jgi:hypothetical protein
LGDLIVTDLATACLHFKTAKVATLLNPGDMSLREPLKHTRWRLQQLSIVDYLRMVEQAHAEASAMRGIADPCSPPRHEDRDAVAEDLAQQQHNDEAKPGIDDIVVDQSVAVAPAVVPAGGHLSPQRKKSNSFPDRGHSAKRPRPRRGQ